MPTEEYEPSGAFEAIKVLGRELQHSKERIRQLEAALSEVSILLRFAFISSKDSWGRSARASRKVLILPQRNNSSTVLRRLRI